MFLLANLRRRVSIRHLILFLGTSTVLTIVYYLRLTRFHQYSHNVPFWPPETPEIWAERAAQVKDAFRHAYHGYEQHAFPHDELLPLSNQSVDKRFPSFNGWGVTAVDSLDTMLLMRLGDEYTRALPMISHSNFSLPTNTYVPFFETVIRYLGGLLAAYAISRHDIFREKADELGSLLAPAFHTASGFPGSAVDTYTKNALVFDSGPAAEISSFQLEYAYLGKITGKKEHIDHATLVTTSFYNADLARSGGMYPIVWDLFSGTPYDQQSTLTVGALADSAHEYTLKQFLLTARTDKRNLEMYLRFTSHVINNLLFLSPNRQLLYVTDGVVTEDQVRPSHHFEHLSCFFPGLLALGAHLLPLNHLDAFDIDVAALADDLSPADRQAYASLAKFNLADLHLWAAEGIAQTCYLTYADQPAGLGPEAMQMDVDQEAGAVRWMDAMRAWKEEEDKVGGWWKSGYQRPPPGVGDIKPWTRPPTLNATVEQIVRPPSARGKGRPLNSFGRDYKIKDPSYYLRPETVESLYMLWRTTGDVKWRHRGWHIFQAIERYAKTDSGYAVVTMIDRPNPRQVDSMPSYFLAETLKYLYLLFLDKDPLPLEKWVFTTEGHALPVFAWSKEERKAYGIP